jgi:NAD(P)H-flavin reductase
LLPPLSVSLSCRPPENWAYGSGFINEEMVREHLLPSGPDSIVAMCGPPPMIKFACIPNLEKVGYTAEQLITF